MKKLYKVNPTNMHAIKNTYNIISAMDKYKNLSFDTFLECRDSIFMYAYAPDCVPIIINGIIACRRTTMDRTNVPELLFYCQPNKIMYSIECLYLFADVGLRRHEIARYLIEACIKDKNDAFISIKIHESDLNSDLNDELSSIGFYKEFFDDGIYTFIKRPTVQTDRGN